jgi:hypothetical protein
MKTVEGYLKDFYELSGKASDISRQLAFAAIAVVWLFKTDTPTGQITIPPDLIWPGILIVAALAADLLQYVAGSLFMLATSKESTFLGSSGIAIGYRYQCGDYL